MNSTLTPKIPRFFVGNLRNSQLLRAISASNLNILDRNLLRPELIRGSLVIAKTLNAEMAGFVTEGNARGRLQMIFHEYIEVP